MKIIKLSFVFYFFYQLGFAQSTPLPKIQSPNAAALGTYGDVSVSLFTGTPNISIPLYTIETGTISIPLSLSYHPGSVKPAQNPGWVGLGWNLNCNGSITRKIRGRKDEFSNESMPTAQNYVPFFPCSTIQSGDSGSAAIQSPDWNNKDWLIYKNTSHNEDIKKYDINSDEFSFNFLGHSGTFYYDNGKWVVASDEHIVVEFNNDFIYPLEVTTIINSYNPTTGVICDEVGRTFKKFTLITDDGNRYTFGGDDALEFSSSYAPEHVNYACNSWLLKKIENYKGEYVNFEYKRDYITCVLGYFGNAISFADLSRDGDSAGSVTPLEQDKLAGQYIFPVYLSKISTKNQTITFDSSVAKTLKYTDNQLNQRITPNHSLFLVDYNLNLLQIKKIDKITIKDVLNNEVKQINFGYNESTTERFTLTKLNENNSKFYSFGYNDVAGMPGLDGNNTDHWGFFNNIDFLQSSLPTTFQKKESGPSYITKGLITSIKYPTGGYTKFAWEPHYYSKVVSQNRSSLTDKTGYAGGSRILSIENFDTNDVLLSQKKYYYIKNYNNTTKSNLSSLSSSGVLNGIPQYDFYITNHPTVNNSTTVSLTLRNYNSLTNFGYSTGSHIGYDEVVEVNKDDSYRKYYFTNFGPDLNGISHYDKAPLMTLGWTSADGPYMPSSSLDIERGKTIGIQDYNSADLCVKKIKSVFRNDNSRFDDYVRQIVNSGSYSVSQGDALIFCSALKKYTYSYYPVSNEETVYDINGLNPITKSTEYKYNLKNQLVSEKTINSKSETLENKTFYPTDLISGVQSVAMQQLVDANRINFPVTTQVLSANQKISEQTTKFTTDPVKTSGLLLPTATYSLKGTGTIDIQKSDDKKISYDLYDSNGNLNQYTPEGGTPVSIIWGYNKTQPIAKIENVSYNTVETYVANLQTLSDTGTETNLLIALNSLRASVPNAIVTTYTYRPLIGISTITDPKGVITYYEYDSYKRLAFIKDQDFNVLQRYCYNYFGQQTNCTTVFSPIITYTNIAKNAVFTKQACAAGSVGSSCVYSVPAGTYSSTVSQADADAQAANEITANGQNFANANGTCIAVPPVPTGLTLTTATATSVNFSWNAVTGAESYKIYKNGIYVSTVTATTSSLSGLAASTAYNIQILASNIAGDSALCTAVSMSTLVSAPTGLTFTSATASVVNFSWTAVAGATTYKIYKNGVYVSTVTATTGSLSGLAASTAYNVQVLASNTLGDGVLCTAVSMTTVPAAPTGLAFASATASAINFSWTAVAGATAYKIYKNGVYANTVTATTGSLSGLTAATAYNVQMLASNASGDGVLCTVVSMVTAPAAPTGLVFTSATASVINFSWTAVAGATAYKIYKNGVYVSTVTSTTGSLSGLTASTAYDVQVLASNASGDGVLCTAVSMSTLPAIPTGLAFTSATATSINFSWTAVTGAIGYKIYKDGVYISTVTTTTGALSGLSAFTAYNVQVLATNTSGDGGLSSAVSMTTAPAAPTGLAFTSATASDINFSWTAVAGATGYKIYKNGIYVSTVTAPTTTGSLSGLTISTAYNVQVLATNASGDGTLCTSVSMSTLPAVPTGLAFTSATATSINFSWTAVAGATAYRIYNGGSDTGITTTTNNGSLSGLTASTAYGIQVLAVNASGSSALCSAVSMGTLPAAPTGLAFTSATPSSISFSWAAVAGATAYKIYKDGVYASTVTTTTGSLSLLTISTTYGVQILASNASGDGALCSSVPMSTLLGAPAGLTLTSATTSSINFSWTAVSGAIGYKIFKNGDSPITTTAASGSFSGLTASTSYTIRVLAYNASGDGLPSSVVMSTTSTPAMLPAPTGLTLTSNTTSSINFSWTAVAGATGYKIFKNGDSPITTTATTGSFSGLAASTSYTIRVLAYNAAGDGMSTSLAMSTASIPAPVIGFHVTAGTYPATAGTSVNGTIVNTRTTPIYVYAAVQSLSGSGVGSGGGAVNGTSLSVSGTFTTSGQYFVSSAYATIAAGATVNFSGGYGGAVGRLLFAYSLTPGGTLNYWYVSN